MPNPLSLALKWGQVISSKMRAYPVVSLVVVPGDVSHEIDRESNGHESKISSSEKQTSGTDVVVIEIGSKSMLR